MVFVDDSRMDLADVAEKYPGIECLRFPSDDPAGVVELLIHLRRRFGKSEIGEEDRLRLQSLRANSTLERQGHRLGSREISRLAPGSEDQTGIFERPRRQPCL